MFRATELPASAAYPDASSAPASGKAVPRNEPWELALGRPSYIWWAPSLSAYAYHGQKPSELVPTGETDRKAD